MVFQYIVVFFEFVEFNTKLFIILKYIKNLKIVHFH